MVWKSGGSPTTLDVVKQEEKGIDSIGVPSDSNRIYAPDMAVRAHIMERNGWHVLLNCVCKSYTFLHVDGFIIISS